MELHNIEAFVKVAERSSFSGAAEVLHLTQPAVSKRVAALEQTLSVKLFDRVGRRIILTEAGKTILTKCQLILNTVDDTQKTIHNLSGHVAGTLSIGTSHHIGLHHLPPVLRQYVRLHPKVEMDIHFLSSEQVCEMVKNGDIELGIITLPNEALENLLAKELWHDPMQFVVSADHSLAQRKRCDLSHLTNVKAILPEKGTYTHSIIEKEFRQSGYELKSMFATNYLQTIKMMVSVGLGWSVLPVTLIDKELHTLNVPGIKLSRKLGIVQHKDRTLSNAALAISALLKNNRPGK